MLERAPATPVNSQVSLQNSTTREDTGVRDGARKPMFGACSVSPWEFPDAEHAPTDHSSRKNCGVQVGRGQPARQREVTDANGR